MVRFSSKIGQIVSQSFANFSQILMISTLFPRIMVHALKYETEAIVHAPRESPI